MAILLFKAFDESYGFIDRTPACGGHGLIDDQDDKQIMHDATYGTKLPAMAGPLRAECINILIDPGNVCFRKRLVCLVYPDP